MFFIVFIASFAFFLKLISEFYRQFLIDSWNVNADVDIALNICKSTNLTQMVAAIRVRLILSSFNFK